MIDGKHVLVTGGTGSLGKVLVRRLLSGVEGTPRSVTVFSRDEAKQHDLRLQLTGAGAVTDDVVYQRGKDLLRFKLGSVADPGTLASALRGAQVVFHAAALKQVPSCEYHPGEAVRTNIDGATNLVRVISEQQLDVEVVVGISTDKACKPVNVMGMTKAIQERVLVEANLQAPTRFVLARYGNVLASRGSVIPLFHQQIRFGGPVTVTTDEMTRFFMNLDQAADTILEAARSARRGEILIPQVPAAYVRHVAESLVGDRGIAVETIGIRPGEKVHESLVSEEEAPRTDDRGTYLAIRPLLPELAEPPLGTPWTRGEYSSATCPLDRAGVDELLAANRMRVDDRPDFEGHHP